MPGLSAYNCLWEPARAKGDSGRAYEDDSILLATDFEGGNGANLRRLNQDHYAVALEPEPGTHVFGGKAYYFCFGIQNKRPQRRSVRVRLESRNWEHWAERTKHVVLRRGGQWSQLDPHAIHVVQETLEAVDVDFELPGAGEPDPVLFASNFHWWPYSEAVAYLRTLRGAQVHEIGQSYEHRPLYAVEIGPVEAPCILNAQTSQPSEMGSLACRAMIAFLLSGDPEAAAIRDRFHFCFVPMANPDGTVHGYGVSDAQGRFPFFEGHLAATGDPSATPEMAAVWRYLQGKRPLLFWEWHSNNWASRPGHILIRYAHELQPDRRLRHLWDDLEERLLTLPETYHDSWTSATEGLHQRSIGFQTVTRLGSIACMIKQHDKFPLEQSRQHAVACLKVATSTLQELPGKE